MKEAKKRNREIKDEKSFEKECKRKSFFSKSDLLFCCLIAITAIATIYFCFKSKSYVDSLREKFPNYYYPTIYEICLWSFIFTIVLIIPKILIENFIFKFTDYFLDKKYFTPDFIKEKTKVKKKMSIYFLKFIHYLALSIFAYRMLLKSEWYPKELFGNGDFSKLYNKGLLGFSFFERPYGFEFHYIINLAYTFADLICVLYIYDSQTDYLIMIFHHFCTTSLIVFSYYINYSSLGSIVMVLHNYTDIVVYLSRAMLYTNFPDIIKKIQSAILLLTFIYARLYVLGKCIYWLIIGPTWESNYINEGLTFVLVSLYILHITWTYKLISIAYHSIMKGKYNDSREFIKDKKKLSKD